MRGFLSAAIAVAIAACGGVTAPDSNLTVAVHLGTAGIDHAIGAVTAPDLTSPLTFNLAISGCSAAGTVSVPPGANRTVTVRTYDAAGVENDSGSVMVDVQEGANPLVTLAAEPVTSIALLTVEPDADTLLEGNTVRLSASGVDANGDTLDMCPVWTTQDSSRATVDSTGLVTAVRRGPVTVVATSAGVTAAAELLIWARVTIDFSTLPEGEFDPDYFESDGIVFPSERCGSEGCAGWYIVLGGGVNALLGQAGFGGVHATFTDPIYKIAVHLAPREQGTATYILNALSASGDTIATASVTVTQDTGDPENTGFGYFDLALPNLPEPAYAFELDNVFVRSTKGGTSIAYEISAISYYTAPSR
jgi:hypothetical protein